MKYQIVFRYKPKLKLIRYDIDKTDYAYIYNWVLIFGFIEIRKWSHKLLK